MYTFCIHTVYIVYPYRIHTVYAKKKRKEAKENKETQYIFNIKIILYFYLYFIKEYILYINIYIIPRADIYYIGGICVA